MKTSDVFVKSLENEGVEYIFGVPGEENLDFLESLSKSKIKMVVTRHEQSAAFMAATIGRLTGKPGVALSTLGPGATNFITSAAYAQLGAMPLMLITGQKPIKKNKQGNFQIINTVDIMKPVTKWSKQIITGNQMSFLVRQAFRVAMEERPGVVHLELPEDIAAEESELRTLDPTMPRRPIAEEKAIKGAVEMIESAKMPLILVGAGANRKTVSKMLTEFIDKTGIPFFNTQMGKGVIDERHPLYMGTAALSANDYVHCAVDRADLIINVGHDDIEKPPFIMTDGKRKVIHINFSSTHFSDIYFPHLEVIGDIANAVWQMKESIKVQKSWDFDYFLRVKHKLEEGIEEAAKMDSFPIKPQRFVDEIRKAMPEDGILALDNGMYKLWFARNYKTYKPNSLLLDNALATMGAGLPSGMAAKLVHPDKKVVVVAGDGGFLMNSQELETAVRLKLDIVIIILVDNGYGMIKWKQESSGMSNFGLEFSNPDFVKYAESYGIKGYRIESVEDFSKTLNKTLEEKGVKIIEIPVDYSENVRFFTKELKEKTCDL